MKACRGSRGKVPHISNLGARWKSCGLLHVPGPNPQYTLNRRLVERARFWRAEKFGVSPGPFPTGKGEGHPVTCRWRQRGGVEVKLYACLISAIRETVN